ncbi:MAG: MMPL family transporter [Crocinitomicaceae bacterium]
MLTQVREHTLGNEKKIAWMALSGVLIISVLFGYTTTKVGFDYDFEAFFSKTDPETKYFQEHRSRFESDNDFIFIALKHEPSIFDIKFLNKVANFVDDLEKDSLVISVQSITHMDEYVKTPFSAAVLSRPYLHLNDASKLEKDSARIYSHPEIAQNFIDREGKALMVSLKHQEGMSKANCDNIKITIDNLLKKHDLKDYAYAGRAIGIGYYINQMIYETGMFIGLSFILVILFLIIGFKSLWGLLLPLSVVGLSMLWIVGFMGMVGEPINLILTTLPSIIFVVAMSDVIHLVSKYLEELRSGLDRIAAVRKAYKEVGKATLMTSLTTAVGFLTLLSVDMQPVQSFGLYTAIGVVLAFILAYTFLPSLLVLTKAPKISSRDNKNTFWYKFLHKSFLMLLKRKAAVGIGFLLLFGLSIYGSSRIIIDYFLMEDLKKENVMRKTYQYFDEEFMGLRPFEIAVEVKDPEKTIYDYEVLQEINKVEEYLVSDYGLKQTFSIVSMLKIANRTNHGGQRKYYSFPTEEESDEYIDRIMSFDKSGQISALVDSTGKYGRISSTIGDIGMRKITKLNEGLLAFLEQETDKDLVNFKLTGTGHLLDRNMSQLSISLFWGLGFAILIVSILMGLLFRSFRMVIIAMIPNILPLVMLGAILGFAGVELKVSTALVFTISFGIAVDDTIHFMSKLKLELNKGRDLAWALRRTFLSTGRAIVLTTLILIGGFLMLMFSDFLGTFYIGLLLSCTLIFALIADLYFLPILVIYFYKPKKKKLANN